MRLAFAPPAAGEDQSAANRFTATLVDIGYLGDLSLYTLRVGETALVKAAVANTERAAGAARPAVGDQAWLSFSSDVGVVLTH